jgi:hypothetical protein
MSLATELDRVLAENAALREQVEELKRELDREREEVCRDVAEYRGILATTRAEASKQASYASDAVSRAERAEKLVAEEERLHSQAYDALNSQLLETQSRLAKVVEALEDITDAGCEFKDERVAYETWQINPGSMERARAALAAALGEALARSRPGSSAQAFAVGSREVRKDPSVTHPETVFVLEELPADGSTALIQSVHRTQAGAEVAEESWNAKHTGDVAEEHAFEDNGEGWCATCFCCIAIDEVTFFDRVCPSERQAEGEND